MRQIGRRLHQDRRAVRSDRSRRHAQALAAHHARWLLVAALTACDALPPCDGEEFIAMQEDFAGYERWRRFELDPPDPRLGAGRRFVYINALPPRGATSFPQCTMIVKVGEDGPDPLAWLMVGMAKRGGDYNPDGANGWEWFDLDLSASGAPLIDWRGPVPPEGRGYECALGEDEPGAEGVGDCNTCHRAADDNDHVLSGPLDLAARGG